MHSAAGDFFGSQSKLIDIDPTVTDAESAEELILHPRNRYNEASRQNNVRTGTYLITGGTGGVGLTMAKWLINTVLSEICCSSLG